ncbi:MAG: hypothetical protein JW841_03615 [Deltaproteobacteria bacterium]|nr:hypothetical protein [Deltaproteobacteria bacterium]
MKQTSCLCTYTITLSISMLVAHLAYADAAPKIDIGWYMPAGFTMGVATKRDKPTGFIGGAEISIVNLNGDAKWFGAYTDMLYDLKANMSRFSIGPEIGYTFFGMDGGYVLAKNEDNNFYHGVAIRPMISMGWVTLFARYDYFFDSSMKAPIEIGLLFKYLFKIHTRPAKQSPVMMKETIEPAITDKTNNSQ